MPDETEYLIISNHENGDYNGIYYLAENWPSDVPNSHWSKADRSMHLFYKVAWYDSLRYTGYWNFDSQYTEEAYTYPNLFDNDDECYDYTHII